MPEHLSILVKPAPLLAVGEAWGQHEVQAGHALAGPSGRVFNELALAADIPRIQWSITNVFNERPPNDAVDLLVHDPARFAAAQRRLFEEIEITQPNLIVAFGNTALFALCGLRGIGNLRGHCLPITQLSPDLVLSRPYKVLPMKNPAVVFRDPTARVTLVIDFLKAARECKFPEVRYTPRQIWIKPTYEDLLEFDRLHLAAASYLVVDIETVSAPVRQITCIGFAPNATHALVVPLVDQGKPGFDYWETPYEETKVLRWLRDVLQRPLPKVFQNGTYDMHWLALYGLAPRGPHEDTMLLFHSKYSELEKGLEALAAVYSNSPPWKTLRPRGSDEKKDG